MSESDSMTGASEVEARLIEVKRSTSAFEAMVENVEREMDEIERAGVFEDASSESLGRLEQAFNTANRLADQVKAAHRAMSEAMNRALRDVLKDSGEPLEEGDYILDGRYRIARRLYQRPRLNLYLGRRVSPTPNTGDDADHPEQVVAIRELILTDLPPETCRLIEAAAFEEFVSPVVLGSPRLPSAGDRVRTEGARHYLVMQLRGTHGLQQAQAITLEELLLRGQEWPYWLTRETVLMWGTQLCRIVARLHRLGVVLGDLNPATILVDGEGLAPWAPVLLVSWPPAPQFWPKTLENVAALYTDVFPIANAPLEHAFVAPEMLHGICDERSDVYSLGAIIYLLMTRYAPVAAARRLCVLRQIERERRKLLGGDEADMGQGEEEGDDAITSLDSVEGLELIPPRLFNRQVSPALERVLLRALELDPLLRYPTVFALVEALEAAEHDMSGMEQIHRPPRTSPIQKMLSWLRLMPRVS